MDIPLPDHPAPTDARPGTDLLSFRIGADVFCLPVTHVREIRAWSHPTPLPGVDRAVAGVINLRGLVLPVIDPAVRLGLSAPPDRTRPVIIVIEAAGRQAGLIADQVMDILSVPTETIDATPSLAGGPAVAAHSIYLAAVALHEGQLLRILLPSRLLAETGAGVTR